LIAVESTVDGKRWLELWRSDVPHQIPVREARAS
jgi:hypothetical protein